MNQRLRLILNGTFSVYVTARQIREGIGDNTLVNGAARFALTRLESSKSEGPCIGVGLVDRGFQVQLDVIS